MTSRLLLRSLPATALGLVLATASRAQDTRQATRFVTVEVETVGVEVTTGSPVVVLQDPASDRTLPVWVGTAEAQAIARSLFGIEVPRPMTHDLLSEVIRRLNASVEEVRVTGQKDGVYFGVVRLRAQREKKAVDIDSRPSDAVALALRTGAPIRVLERLFDEAPRVEVAPPDSTPDIARLIGLTVVAPTAESRKAFALPDRDGVLVLIATDNAAAAGMRRGDLILTVNGRTPTTPSSFREAVRSAPIDEPVRIRIWREGTELDLKVERSRTFPPGVRA